MLLDIFLGLHSALDDGKDPGPEYVLYSFPEKECLKLYVTGTCGECEHWLLNTAQVHPADEVKLCGKRSGEFWHKDDGCIKFEQKNE